MRKEDLLTVPQTARMIGRGRSMVYQYVRDGFLRPVEDPSLPPTRVLFHRQDVQAFLDARAQGFDLAKVAHWAQEARAQTLALARKVDELYGLLGLETTALAIDEESVTDLHVRALARMLVLEPPSALELAEWAKIFYAFDDQYLGLVATHTASPDPWAPYLLAANHLIATADKSSQDVGYAHALRALIAARQRLQQVSYFFVRNRNGHRVADQAFLDTTDNDILALALR